MRIVKRHAGGPENQVINFFRPKDIYVDFKSGQELIFHIEGGTHIVRIFFSALA